jgi:hypothetical protein
MKRNIILAVVAILCLAMYLGPYVLLLLVLPIAYFIGSRKENIEVQRVTYTTMEEVERKYGAPDDVVVLNASRANEIPSLILFYDAIDVMIISGMELKLSDLVGVMPKNMATPYTVDECAVILSTKDTDYPTIRLRVGYDYGLACEITAQIDSHIKK